jgi:hypothetical protein
METQPHLIQLVGTSPNLWIKMETTQVQFHKLVLYYTTLQQISLLLIP